MRFRALRLEIREAVATDRPNLRRAIVGLQERERELSATRLPGEAIADAYLDYLTENAVAPGGCFVAEVDGAFAGFAAGWVQEDEAIAETPDSSRYGLVSDIFVLTKFRGKGIAAELLAALEARLKNAGLTRLRVRALAADHEARAIYERAGFAPYEITYDKHLSAAATTKRN